MSLHRLVRLQYIFALASVTYLLVSWWRKETLGEALSAAPIGASILMFIVYAVCLQLARLPKTLWYRLAMGVAVVLFGGGGVIGNIWRYLQDGLDEYASFGAFIIAVSINLFGTILNVMATLAMFKSKNLKN